MDAAATSGHGLCLVRANVHDVHVQQRRVLFHAPTTGLFDLDEVGAAPVVVLVSDEALVVEVEEGDEGIAPLGVPPVWELIVGCRVACVILGYTHIPTAELDKLGAGVVGSHEEVVVIVAIAAEGFVIASEGFELLSEHAHPATVLLLAFDKAGLCGVLVC